VHVLLDVLPGRVVYATNRRNGVDFDLVAHDLRDGSERVLYDRGGWVDEAAVSSDEQYVLLGRPGAPARSQQLLLVEVSTGRVSELSSLDEPAAYTRFRWLPDSSGFVATSDAGREFAGVARYDLSAASWRWLATDDDHDLVGVLDPGGARLLVVTRDDGADRAAVHDPSTGAVLSRLELAADGVICGRLGEPVWSLAGGMLAATRVSPAEPGGVYSWDGDGVVRRTEPSLDPSTLVAPTSHRVPAYDGEEIPCFVYRDDRCDGSAVLLIHGGPASASARTWDPLTQALVSAGHAVVVPNVRGSTTYGKRWAALDDVTLRLDSVADLASLHRWLPDVGLDPRRAALLGQSYGGYMVLAGLTMQPELWAAGVDIVGISSFVTFLENTAPYRRAHREREYGSLAHDRDFLEQASPLTHIDAVRAPLLVVHGANDPRVPLSETEQLVAAVRERGVECELLVYADEGHGLKKLHNRLDAYPKMFDFLDRHLGVA
ncbi:MAG: S9 family peptidase, partial [Nocardioidaceae bacterium]